MADPSILTIPTTCLANNLETTKRSMTLSLHVSRMVAMLMPSTLDSQPVLVSFCGVMLKSAARHHNASQVERAAAHDARMSMLAADAPWPVLR